VDVERVRGLISSASLNAEYDLAWEPSGFSPLAARLAYQGWATLKHQPKAEQGGPQNRVEVDESKIGGEVSSQLKGEIEEGKEMVHVTLRRSDSRPLLSFSSRVRSPASSFAYFAQIPLGEHGEGFGQGFPPQARACGLRPEQRVFLASGSNSLRAQGGVDAEGLSLVFVTQVMATHPSSVDSGWAPRPAPSPFEIARADYLFSPTGFKASFQACATNTAPLTTMVGGNLAVGQTVDEESILAGAAPRPGEPEQRGTVRSQTQASAQASAGAWWSIRMLST